MNPPYTELTLARAIPKAKRSCLPSLSPHSIPRCKMDTTHKLAVRFNSQVQTELGQWRPQPADYCIACIARYSDMRYRYRMYRARIACIAYRVIARYLRGVVHIRFGTIAVRRWNDFCRAKKIRFIASWQTAGAVSTIESNNCFPLPSI